MRSAGTKATPEAKCNVVVSPFYLPENKRQLGAMKKRKAEARSTSASSTKRSKSYQKLKFVAFCAARQAVLLNRRDGLPRAEWTNDRILARARFCNIDRRDDAVTAELTAAISAHSHWGLREKVASRQ